MAPSTRDIFILAGCVGGSVALYQLMKRTALFLQRGDWVPIGRVKELYVFPLKSGKAKPVFALFCDRFGVLDGENRDRMFLATDREGHFFTGRVKPMLTQVECEVRNGTVHVGYEGRSISINISDILEQKNVIPATMFFNKRHDGLDCGEEAAKFISAVVGEDARLLMYTPALYTERTVETNPKWWNNNPVPKRKTNAAYTNLTPHMISTQASLDELNRISARTEDDLLTSVQFRANIVVEGCPAWDEDRWAELRFGPLPTEGATEIQCIKPCERCVMIDVDPKTGAKMTSAPPLKKLKEFRMPEGNMLESLGRHPIFGVQCAQNRNGFVHIGQTVWARYKKSAF